MTMFRFSSRTILRNLKYAVVPYGEIIEQQDLFLGCSAFVPMAGLLNLCLVELFIQFLACYNSATCSKEHLVSIVCKVERPRW